MSDSLTAFRQRIFAAVVPALEAEPGVRACWEGGSVALGRADAYSDIDLYALADAVFHEAVQDTFERALAGAVTIAHTWRVAPSSFPEVTQRIHLLADAPRFFAVDCAVLPAHAALQFLERERHGQPRVLFDHDGQVTAPPLDRVRHDTRLRQRLAQIRAAWPVYRMIVEKELARGRALDAIGFYFNGLLRPLLELVGMRHRPERFDYGWRYLHHELPLPLQRELQDLAYVADPAQLGAQLPAVDRLAARLFDELGAQ